ncbi:MAG: hypothetical protein H7Z72_22535, partial [Bacteroidetes bacterium]|nr:hypothetical protein [Fibrella sp.]
LIWDIMWHMSIGRDGLFSPPHLVLYVGAVVAGLFSAYQILSLTFSRNEREKSRNVRFWGIFYGSLGAMFCAWGALAILTSAPFDDWWHNTYGLDVQILTPPHTVLLLGMMTVQFGAMVGVLALQNQPADPAFSAEMTDRRASRLRFMFAISAGLLLAVLYGLFSENMGPSASHNSSSYLFAGIVFPIYLLAVGRASQLRYPLTVIALIYILAIGGPSWVIQFFPATPRLGPVLNPITTYQPYNFPLLLVIPGFVLDKLMHRFDRPATGKKLNDWLLAVVLGCAFLIVFLAVQWPFGTFLQTSPYARNAFFLSYSWTYNSPPDWQYRYAFGPWYQQTPAQFAEGFGTALVAAIVSARIGLLWGNWMKRVQR